jgi:hypothetical protein
MNNVPGSNSAIKKMASAWAQDLDGCFITTVLACPLGIRSQTSAHQIADIDSEQEADYYWSVLQRDR